MLFFVGCEDVLDIEPTDIITAEQLFSDPGGVKVYMANLYFQMPVDSFVEGIMVCGLDWDPRWRVPPF